MTVAGHSRAHLPQPTQRSWSTRAAMPFTTAMAPRGHTLTQQPQATQSSVDTTPLRRLLPYMTNQNRLTPPVLPAGPKLGICSLIL